jgi:tetratricopeptide (TPR) repeat protein
MALNAGSRLADREVSREFLRLVLKYDPSHPWAANDLGYTMLESGGSLEEAERLIEIAYEQLPEQANIVDSLGWVRYHRGLLEDTTDPETGEPVAGAISLLRQASELIEADNDDGTVHDHLGDALYAGGYTAEAIEAWGKASRRAQNALSRLRAAGMGGGVRFREVQRLATGAAMKRNVIQLGQEPEIAPQRGVSNGSTGGS